MPWDSQILCLNTSNFFQKTTHHYPSISCWTISKKKHWCRKKNANYYYDQSSSSTSTSPFTNKQPTNQPTKQPTNQPTKAADEQTSCAPWRGFTPKQTPQRLLLLMTSSCILPKRCHAFLSYYLMERKSKKNAFWHLCGRKKVERINTSKGDCQSLVASHPDPHLPPQPKRNLDAWALKKPSPSISNVQWEVLNFFPTRSQRSFLKAQFGIHLFGLKVERNLLTGILPYN